MSFAVEIEGLSKSYGRVRAVEDISFKVGYGEIFGLIGPNGAGKSTTIKVVMGIIRPDRGRISVLGGRPGDRRLYRYIGYSPQEKETALYMDLTVYENLKFFASLYGLDNRDVVEEALNFVELEDKRDELVENLSGGMRARLSLALALLNKPKLLVLDEPTIGVDPTLRIKFWRYFRELVDGGVTILLTTHYGDEAEKCDRLAMMYSGKILKMGSVDEILSYTGARDFEEAFYLLVSQEV